MVDAEPYRIQIRGPGFDSCLELRDRDDLEILDAIIAKIRAELESKSAG
jgi:hypothetical protein